MPTAEHQWLITWIARKMTVDGFTVAGFEGPAPHGWVWNMAPQPFEIQGVRPDVWGIGRDGTIAVGEAKTYDDVDTSHTRRQLNVYTRLHRRADRQLCRVYLAVPRSSVRLLDRVLTDVHMLTAGHIFRMHVPDCLLEAA